MPGSLGNGSQQRNIRKDWKVTKENKKQQKKTAKAMKKTKSGPKAMKKTKSAAPLKRLTVKTKSSAVPRANASLVAKSGKCRVAEQLPPDVVASAQAALDFLAEQAAEQPTMELKAWLFSSNPITIYPPLQFTNLQAHNIPRQFGTQGNDFVARQHVCVTATQE